MRNDFCSDYLAHSAKGTSWRKKSAKYINRIWKNGKWVYEYKITGKGYKKDAIQSRARSQLSSEQAKKATSANAKNSLAKAASRYGSNSVRAMNNYYTKSLAGAIERGMEIIEGLLKPTVTVTRTSNLMPARTKKRIK